MDKKTRREFLKTAAVGAAALSVSTFPKISQGAEKPKGSSSQLKIDMHSHIEIPEAVDLLTEKPKVVAAPLADKSYAYQQSLVAKITPQLRDPERKIADLQEMGLDMIILSILPSQFFYNLQGDLALKVCRFQNDRIASIVQKYPKKFRGMANVPIQNVEAAVMELERAVRELKLTGVEIGSNLNGKYLGDPSFRPFFEKARALDIPVYIHPHNPPGTDRMKDYYFMNILGFPLDTTLTAGSIIFSGTFDQLPGLKIILSHAGGYLPYIIGRMEHGFKVRPECQEIIQKSPVEYMKMFYYDTIAHSPNGLRFLISTVGADHVLLGTDYPYDMGDFKPLQSINAVKGLSAKDKEKIIGKNAQILFNLA